MRSVRSVKEPETISKVDLDAVFVMVLEKSERQLSSQARERLLSLDAENVKEWVSQVIKSAQIAKAKRLRSNQEIYDSKLRKVWLMARGLSSRVNQSKV